MIDRRTLFKTAALAPAAVLPEIPCNHVSDMQDRGKTMILHLIATRERDVPVLEIENWKSDLKTCDICDASWIEERKVREAVDVGKFRMTVPPVTKPSELIWPIQTTCRAWVDGEELDWLTGEASVTFHVEHRRVFLR